MKLRSLFTVATLSCAILLAAPAWAQFSFNTGNTDLRLGAVSRPASGTKLETETADDFALTGVTVINHATVTGLINAGVPLSHITQVEVEIYNIFPADSDTTRTPAVVTRVNSPSDNEIGSATRDSSDGSLSYSAT